MTAVVHLGKLAPRCRFVTWGDPDQGGDSSQVQEKRRNVQHIHANLAAFAAILESGAVVTWGDTFCGGNSSQVQEQLRNVQNIQPTRRAFAATLESLDVVTCGDIFCGGDSSQVQEQLRTSKPLGMLLLRCLNLGLL